VRIATLSAFLVLAFNSQAFCQGNDSSATAAHLQLDLTLLDLPFNAQYRGQWPSMAQSRSIALSMNELGCFGIQSATGFIRSPVVRVGAVAGMEAALLLISTYAPFGNTWLHEEYHRAVLSSRGIGSYDGMYDFNLDIDNVSIYNVADEALINLKANHPEDLVRLEAAGYEGQVDLANSFLQDGLRHGTPLVEFPAFYALFANTFYLYLCTTNQADAATNEFNEKENTIDVRDFDGWDYTSWSYDLHRPDEPYTARGVHSSGVGVNRYLLWTDLTADEQNYVRLQTKLSLLNFVRPQLFGMHPVHVGIGGISMTMTAGLQHYLTPFGYEAGIYVLSSAHSTGFTAAINAYVNRRQVLPGIDCGMFELPFVISRMSFSWSPRLALWFQPKGLRFDAASASPGLLTSQRIGIALDRHLGAFAELELKTSGWAAGTEETGPAAAVRIGTTLKL